MRKINFSKDILPHCIAIGIFLIVTIFFFNPIFFDNKVLNQSDITQWEGSSKAMRDYRIATGDEALWTPSMFSGMPGYLVNVEWGNQAVSLLKTVLAFNLPHPICNIYLAFICYYIMLLAFGVRPYLAIAGAIAFGLSNHLIVGLSVGHSARIGAIAFMPLVMAGIHLVFSNKKVLGFAVTTAGLALHFRENHLQITYYMLIIVIAYGIVQLVIFFREKRAPEFFKAFVWLVPAALIAVGTFIAPMWAVLEYTAYSRSDSELSNTVASEAKGVGREYAFRYNYAIDEPLTLLIPNYYGGSNNLFVQDRESETYKALARTGDENTFNQLAYYSTGYWGPSTPFPYYAGAIIIFLFVAGIMLTDRKFAWWLLPICVLALMMSWGSNFSAFNYFIFDYLPGYNKFRSVTFTVIIIVFSMPLLGFIGLEKLMSEGLTPAIKKKLLIAFGITGGLCLLLLLVAGMYSFLKDGEEQMPQWFVNALAADRKSSFRSDAFRSLVFITLAFGAVYFEIWKKFVPVAFYSFLIAIILIDIAGVDTRYLTKEDYRRKRENTFFNATEADQEILKDKSYYRVYNINTREAFVEARTSYYHNSLGGYHGVKLKRYQDLFDSCLFKETNELIQNASEGNLNLGQYGVINMLNAKYLVYGGGRDNIMLNSAALGNAWFVKEAVSVNSPAEELKKVCDIDTRYTAVVDASQFKVGDVGYDSAATIQITEHRPNYLKYESNTSADGLAVFSEIYYPKGWVASIDGKETEIIRANYVLRALQVPAGKHTVEFKFLPNPYVIGNKITMASSWLMLLVVVGCIGWTLRKDS